MAPLIILVVSFILFLLINKYLLKNKYKLSLAGRAALAIMLFFTGAAHFINTDLMVAMLPEFIPLKKETVLFTGLLEIAAAIGLVMDKTSKLTSILLIVFFIFVIPNNIKGSI